MSDNPSRLSLVVTLIDEANAVDPNIEICPDTGAPAPKELLYGQRMTRMLGEFNPEASENLKIAARAQHIERWKSPRTNFPEGRTGYKKWRSQLSVFHADRATELMAQAGYNHEEQQRVRYLIQKRQIKRDPETQALEDVICLVFLKHYLAGFAGKHDEPKLIDIIQKTWAKMSETGHSAALNIQLPDTLQALVAKALA
jgi:hypothetical protein